MNQVSQLTLYTHEVKQSKFIAHLMPFSLYEETLQTLKNEHPKARHFVVAFRYLNEFNQIIEHSSDDGEPKGTSGKPTLFVLQGNQLINSALIIVRYFGGTKLGTGGLVRAYSDASNEVIIEAKLDEYKELVRHNISFEYSSIRMVEYECLIHSIEIVEKTFEAKTMYRVKATKNDMQQFLDKLQRVIEVYPLP